MMTRDPLLTKRQINKLTRLYYYNIIYNNLANLYLKSLSTKNEASACFS